MNVKLPFSGGGIYLPLDLPPGLPESNRVGIYQYECQNAIFWSGDRSAPGLPVSSQSRNLSV